MKDPYQVLGLSKTATQDDIKNAYRSQAKKLHPDLNPGNKEAEAKFKEAAAAYERIGTAEERAKFDRGETPEQIQEQQRQQQQGPGAGPGAGPFYHQTQQEGARYTSSFGEDFGGADFFEEMLRSAGRGRTERGAARGPARGEDQHYQMSVDFKDAALGAEREITLPQGKKLKVRIPPGIETGARLRFKSQGGPGQKDAPPGDAYVEISVSPLAGFTRKGRDIETEVPVSFFEGLGGGEIQVPTIDGPVMLKVPAGITTGSRLRIRGKGVAWAQGRGDQIVALKVALPSKIDPGLQEAVRALAEKYAYNPRAES